MSNQPPQPDLEKVKQTIANSRRSRLEMELVGLELEEVIAKFEHHKRQQRLQRVRHSLSVLVDESHKLEQQNSAEISS